MALVSVYTGFVLIKVWPAKELAECILYVPGWSVPSDRVVIAGYMKVSYMSVRVIDCILPLLLNTGKATLLVSAVAVVSSAAWDIRAISTVTVVTSGVSASVSKLVTSVVEAPACNLVSEILPKLPPDDT